MSLETMTAPPLCKSGDATTFRQRIFFVEQGRVGAALDALADFTVQGRRAVAVVQHIGAPVAQVSQPGLAQSDAKFGVFPAVGFAETFVKAAHAQEGLARARYVHTDKRRPIKI